MPAVVGVTSEDATTTGPDCEVQRPEAGTSGDDGEDEAEVAARMAAEISDATYYITDYAGKVQPHLHNLFLFLQDSVGLKGSSRRSLNSSRADPCIGRRVH